MSVLRWRGDVAERATDLVDGHEGDHGRGVHSSVVDAVMIAKMVDAYRRYGHFHATLDPLKLTGQRFFKELDPIHYGFSKEDLDRSVFVGDVFGCEFSTPRKLLETLKSTYCSTLGVEFMHVSDHEVRDFIQDKVENSRSNLCCANTRRSILLKLIEAEGFEKFLGCRYPNVKRYSLEGGEAMIPALDQLIRYSHSLGIKEAVIGMAHRGRLNVLGQIMGKPHRALFHEFHGGSSVSEHVKCSGDIKYHLGLSSSFVCDTGSMNLSLAFNPSHLEAVDPVVLGMVRAKQHERVELNGISDKYSVLPILIHGDAALSGQGIVAESLALSMLEGYETGGSLHLIVNNQIGFTTDPSSARSSIYPSDVAKVVEAPVFHVNGDDPDAIFFASKLAMEVRQKFHRPVMIDMVCYRRFGHNEMDDPTFTQPVMHERIGNHRTVLQIYADELLRDGVIDETELSERQEDWEAYLNEEHTIAEQYKPTLTGGSSASLVQVSGSAISGTTVQPSDTGMSVTRLRELGLKLFEVPFDFTLHNDLGKLLDGRRSALSSGNGVDWSTAEALAFASLLEEGYCVRLSGQDSRRGTFSQRHAVWYNQKTGEAYFPFSNVYEGGLRFASNGSETCGSEKKACEPCEVMNSILSEEAVLGFEYGHSLMAPNTLNLWEAQFGDFANTAQVIIDQFIASGEMKWLYMSGLVCLLPHGYEGHGPEHSSARLERYLQMCADNNLQVANCTTPANYFHILRRQILGGFRKPLILMAPKSLLRDERCVSSLSDMGSGTAFSSLLPDSCSSSSSTFRLRQEHEIQRMILCSGRVYYDLCKKREEHGLDHVSIIRIEQLYPFPVDSLDRELARFGNATDVVWCQEEPMNMGAWLFVEAHLLDSLTRIGHKVKCVRYAGREASAATACGVASVHNLQTDSLLRAAFC